MISNQKPPSSSALVDLMGGGPSTSTTAGVATPPADDEWSFTSALPTESALPTTNRVRVLDSLLAVDFEARRKPGEPRTIQIMALFSNKSSQPLTELHFQVAVERVCFFLPFKQPFKYNITILMNLYRHTILNLTRKPAGTSSPSNPLESNKKCRLRTWTSARGTPSKFASKCRTNLVDRPRRNRAWCRH